MNSQIDFFPKTLSGNCFEEGNVITRFEAKVLEEILIYY